MISKEQRKQLQSKFKEIKIEAGVYQIKNTINNKVFLDTTKDLKTLNGKIVTLNTGVHSNKLLQKEWNEFGSEAYVIETLEVLEPNENQYVEIKDELKKLKESWLLKLQPFGERGYHHLK